MLGAVYPGQIYPGGYPLFEIADEIVVTIGDIFCSDAVVTAVALTDDAVTDLAVSDALALP